MAQLTPAQFDKVMAKLTAAGLSEQDALAEIKTQGFEAPSLTSKGIDYALRALDYTGGIGRGTVAGALEIPTGKDLVSFSDVIKGRVPSSADMMEKMGVPKSGEISDVLPFLYSDTGEGWPLQKGGALDASARGFSGLVADVALDPLTYLTMGAAPLVSKLGRTAEIAAKPLSMGVEKLGEKVYKSGLKSLDTRALEKGGEAVSPYMLKQGMGVFKGQEGLLKQMLARTDELNNMRASKYASAPDALVEPVKASEGAFEYLTKLEQNPYMAPKVEEGLDFLALANKPMSLEQASAVKTGLYDALPASAFDVTGKMTSMGQNLNEKLSKGYRQQIIDQANASKAGLGNEIDLINQEMGAYLSAQKPLRKEIAKEGRKDAVTQVDAMTAAFSPAALAAKQAVKTLNAGPVRTTVGYGLNQLGQNIPEPIWKQILLESQNTNGR